MARCAKDSCNCAGEVNDAIPSPLSLDEAIRRWQDSANVPASDRALQRQVARSEIEVETAANLDELQFPGWDHEQEFAGQQRMFPTGYGSIIDNLAKGLDVRLQTVVRSIDYSGSRVQVATNAGSFDARRVVLTVPLGVLQRGAIRFTPELPAEKRGAISRLGMGLLDKVVLRFRQSFWPKSHILAFLTDQLDQWPDVFNLQPVCGQPVLAAFKSGRAVRRRAAHQRRIGGRADAAIACRVWRSCH